MTSPSESLRKHLQSRATKTLIQAGVRIGRLSDSQKKSPSQKRSESIRKKHANRAGVKYNAPDIKDDCHTCKNYPCGKTVSTCSERSVVNRCLQCGQKVRHYIDPDCQWKYCPVCKEVEDDMRRL